MSEYDRTPEEENEDPFDDPFFSEDEKGEKSNGDWTMEWGTGGSWFMGIALILVGGVLVLQNFFEFDFNWWAIFIVWPGLGMLTRSLRRGRGFRAGSLAWGLVVTGVGVILMFDLPWDFAGPALLIVAGLLMIIRQFF